MSSHATSHRRHSGAFPEMFPSILISGSNDNNLTLDKREQKGNKTMINDDTKTVREELTAEELERLRSLKDILKETNWMFDNSLGAYTSAGRR